MLLKTLHMQYFNESNSLDLLASKNHYKINVNLRYPVEMPRPMHSLSLLISFSKNHSVTLSLKLTKHNTPKTTLLLHKSRQTSHTTLKEKA